MNIKSARFLRGIIGSGSDIDERKPQIAFVGRSNVGKSSVINTLTGVKKLAIASATPGRTLQINFFLINEKVFFVDLPGYGYSKTSLQKAEKIRELIIWYLTSGEMTPQKIILVIDANIGPTEFDMEMMEILKEKKYDFIVVANKIDKVKNSELSKKKSAIIEGLGTDNIICFSTKTKDGRLELLKNITS